MQPKTNIQKSQFESNSELRKAMSQLVFNSWK